MVTGGLLKLTEHSAVGRARLLLAEEFTSTIEIQIFDIDGRLERALRLNTRDRVVVATHLESFGALDIKNCFDHAKTLYRMDKLVSYICVEQYVYFSRYTYLLVLLSDRVQPLKQLPAVLLLDVLVENSQILLVAAVQLVQGLVARVAQH